MGFLNKFNKSNDLSKDAIKLIYSSLKKRRLYQAFKRGYKPLVPLEWNDITPFAHPERFRREFTFSDNETSYEYLFDSKRDYSDTRFFTLHQAVSRILLKAAQPFADYSRELTPGTIVEYTIEDYFKERNKKEKPHIKDVTFSLITGIIFAVLAVLMLVGLCFWLMPTFIVFFTAFLTIVSFIGFAFTLIELPNY